MQYEAVLHGPHSHELDNSTCSDWSISMWIRSVQSAAHGPAGEMMRNIIRNVKLKGRLLSILLIGLVLISDSPFTFKNIMFLIDIVNLHETLCFFNKKKCVPFIK